MVRKRDAPVVSGLHTLNSPNQDVNENRRLGLELVEKLSRKPHIATKSDIKWFWEDLNDFDLDPTELYSLAKTYIERNFDELNKAYPFELTEWFLDWYRYMPDALYMGLDNTGQVDWNIFFTLAAEKLSDSSSFHYVIKALNVTQSQYVRKAIYQKIADDPDLRDKVMKYQPLPSIFTNYCSYDRIRKEVARILHPSEDRLPDGCRKAFKEAEKIMKEEGVDLNEALSRL